MTLTLVPPCPCSELETLTLDSPIPLSSFDLLETSPDAYFYVQYFRVCLSEPTTLYPKIDGYSIENYPPDGISTITQFYVGLGSTANCSDYHAGLQSLAQLLGEGSAAGVPYLASAAAGTYQRVTFVTGVFRDVDFDEPPELGGAITIVTV